MPYTARLVDHPTTWKTSELSRREEGHLTGPFQRHYSPLLMSSSRLPFGEGHIRELEETHSWNGIRNGWNKIHDSMDFPLDIHDSTCGIFHQFIDVSWARVSSIQSAMEKGPHLLLAAFTSIDPLENRIPFLQPMILNSCFRIQKVIFDFQKLLS